MALTKIILEQSGHRIWRASFERGSLFGAGDSPAAALGDFLFHHPTSLGIELSIPPKTTSYPEEAADAALAQHAAEWTGCDA